MGSCPTTPELCSEQPMHRSITNTEFLIRPSYGLFRSVISDSYVGFTHIQHVQEIIQVDQRIETEFLPIHIARSVVYGKERDTRIGSRLVIRQTVADEQHVLLAKSIAGQNGCDDFYLGRWRPPDLSEETPEVAPCDN